METKARIIMMIPHVETANAIRLLLVGDGYAVSCADSIVDGTKELSEKTDLVILDAVLWNQSGFLVCEEIRKNSNVPVMFVSNCGTESDILLGLMSGGDDYVRIPFSNAELLGRVHSLIRRYRVYKGKMSIGVGAQETYTERSLIKIHNDYNDVSVDGKNVDMPELEYRILRLLMQYPNKIFSAENIYESVWEEPYFYSCNNTVMVHIRRLRMRIEKDPKNPVHIKTVWGRGYRFE